MLNRREWLKASIFGAAGLYLPATWAAVTHPLAATATQNTNKKLIIILLRGAMDGLNVVVPYGDAAYYPLRPTLALAKPNSGTPDSVLDLDGFFGLNPALSNLMPLWQAKELAFIHASGSPSRSRSHFDAQDYMETATPDNPTTQTGWLNRLLVALGTPTVGTSTVGNASLTHNNANPSLQALVISPNMPRIAMGKHALTLLNPGQSAATGSYINSVNAHKMFDDLYQGNTAIAQAYQTAQTSSKALQATLNADQQEQMQAANGSQSVHGFAADAQQLATLMHARDDIGFGFFGLSGWDTHVNQGKDKGQLANSLTSLATGLLTLKTGLKQKWADTTVVVMSEFGRTTKENGYGGTDHGHGNAMFVLGGGIHGQKVYGKWPGLAPSQLNEGRDLVITTDFRQVLSGILQTNYSLTPAQMATIFPNFSPKAVSIGDKISASNLSSG